MASIYRFKKNGKKEDPDALSAKKSVPQNDDFFPFLFGEKDFSDQAEPSAATETEGVASPDAEDTRSFNLVDFVEQTKDNSVGDTITFPVSDDSKEETKSIPEELLRALQSTPVDNKMIDDVFGHTPGTVTASSTQEDYDKTTALLKEVFGTGTGKKKKKRKGAEEISDPFESTKTLDEALEEAQLRAKEETDAENYVAVHDSEEDKTREFHSSFSIEEELAKISSSENEKENQIPELAEEVRVPDLDNPYSDTYDELDNQKLKRELGLPEEFSSPDEYDEFSEHLRGRIYQNLCRCLWSFLAFFVVLYLESATFSNIYHPDFLRPGGVYNSVIYLLVDLQLVLIGGILSFSVIEKGLKGLFALKPNRHTAAAFALLFALVHPALLLFFQTQEYPLFGSVAMLFLFMSALAEFIESKRILRTFRVCGRKGEKLVAVEAGEDSAEAEAFREQLKGDPKFFSVRKTTFIDGFFSRVEKSGKAEKSFAATFILSLLLSIGFAVFSYWKGASLPTTVNRFMTMAMMTFPLSGVFTVILPFSHIAKKAERTDCAIIGADDADEYASADAVSFTDKEIFPPKHVKVTTIRTYGQTRIDKAILYAAMVFQKLGGPLSHVFKKTISGVYTEIPENFDFLEITADGLCAKIEGKDIFVGNKNYLLSYDFGYTKDTMDAEFESKSGKIMYMVIGSELAAKFYIRYSMSKRFKKTITSLFKCGICPAVKTCDPNVDAELFRILLQNDKIPSGIIKTCDAMKDAPADEKSESGLVCNSSIANLLSAFTLCDALHHLCRSNVVMKIFSVLIGAGVVLFLFFIQDLGRISGLFAMIYQLMWMIPVIIPSMSE